VLLVKPQKATAWAQNFSVISNQGLLAKPTVEKKALK
jgi:hypothetical protein